MGVTIANSTAATLKAGVPNLLTLNSLAAGMALDGAMIHARNMNGTPVGTFSDAGGVFVPFPGCGKNKQGQLNGVVHSKLISEVVRIPRPPFSLRSLFLLSVHSFGRNCHSYPSPSKERRKIS
jgi:hypothetical protein